MVTSENPMGIHPLLDFFLGIPFIGIKEVSYSEQYWVAYYDDSKCGNVKSMDGSSSRIMACRGSKSIPSVSAYSRREEI